MSKRHSRKRPGSRNRRKSALALARLHRKIRNIRQDFLHKVTTELAKTKRVIVIEDLHVRGMVQNRALARAIFGRGFLASFRRMLTYKCAWYGSELIVAPRFLREQQDVLGVRVRDKRATIVGAGVDVPGVQHAA
ncbi:RNA-guided endonuclease InsQ/TnpB family protein [Alicyclobacillus acidocaldarius]|uniref:RNA-guided endonuclease InsQ/TnpB family protein n=1 Tax=Alicyclobacillus acidocaldarius TaxID=405212 RepID=UPI001ED94265|nr:transposase [Alicyclobacillus acidocaldarius]